MHLPIEGPAQYSPEWYAGLKDRIGASESAAACGVSEDRQPLDIYLEKTGQKEPFEGNDYTRRGHRFQPFLAAEYTARTGIELVTEPPLYFHPVYKFIAASPDGWWKDNPKHLVELKCCNWRRAQKLGEEGSDDIFDDWNMQAHQQILVMDAEVCDVFVMVDLHTYRHYIVERNEDVMAGIIRKESELFDRIKRLDPPEPNYDHRSTLELVKLMYGSNSTTASRELSRTGVEAWVEYNRLGDQARKIEKERDNLKARLLGAIGDAACGVFPSGTTAIYKKVIPIAGHVRKPSSSLRLIQQEFKRG